MKRYWKGSDLQIEINITDKKGNTIPFAILDELTVYLKTTGEEYVKVSKGRGIESDVDGNIYIRLNEHSLDYLPDGLLRYDARWKISAEGWDNGYDTVQSCETDIFVKTPDNYTPKSNVQEKSVTYTANGDYVLEPDGSYEGMSRADIKVELPLESKAVTYTANGDYVLEPDGSYEGMSRADIKVELPLESKAVTYTANGDYVLTPDGGYEGLGEVTVNVEIPFPLEVKTVSITENESTTTITTGDGYSGMSEVNVNVKVPITIKVGENGIKLANSTFTEVPQGLDFSDVTDMSHMFQDCSNLTTIPEMNTSNVTDMSYLFTSCYSLITVPSMDTSKVTNMSWLFRDCYSLTTVPLMDTSKVTNMENMFLSCRELTSIPLIDTSQITNMSWLFRDCRKLTSIPPIDTSNVTNMYGMFDSCYELTSVPEMNTSNVTNMWYMFDWCEKLTDLGGLVGLKCDLDLSRCPLTHDSLMNVINKAADVTASPVTLTLGSTNLAKLTDEEKSIATSKGWTLA